MTAQRDADVESLRKSAHRPLDVFLVVSVILLFLAVSTVVAFVVIIDSRHRSIALRDEETSSRRVYNVRKCCCAQKFSKIQKKKKKKDPFLVFCPNVLLCCFLFLNRRTLWFWNQVRVSLILISIIIILS